MPIADCRLMNEGQRPNPETRQSALDSRHSAFSLIELLVAVAIIAILAGMLLASVALVRRHARKIVATTEVKGLETAWKNYYSTYRRWPTFAEESDSVAIADAVAAVLRGFDDAGTNNPKRIKFMEFNRLNAVTNPISPWGRTSEVSTNHYYYVKFDVNYDDVIDAGASASDPPANAVRRKVIVWTINPDVDPEESGYVIGSWQL